MIVVHSDASGGWVGGWVGGCRCGVYGNVQCAWCGCGQEGVGVEMGPCPW